MVSIDGMGLHVNFLVAGFAGAICYVATAKSGQGARGIVGGLVTGPLAANYLAAVSAQYLGNFPGVDLLGAFVVGLTGTVICRRLLSKAGTFDPQSPNGGPK